MRVDGRLSPFIELGVGFNPELTARDNIEHQRHAARASRAAELSERFDAILEFAELERFVDQKLKNFSSGMQLRLAYSIAIQVPFDILLLDEVLAVGDERFQEKCFETFDEIRETARRSCSSATISARSPGSATGRYICRQGTIRSDRYRDRVVGEYRDALRVA